MKLKPVKLAPALIAVGVIVLVCVLRVLTVTETVESSSAAAPARRFDFFERLERMTYDMRVRIALNFPAPVATNVGFVFLSDDTIDQVSKGLLGNSYGLYWPRHVYGRLIRELTVQQAKTVALDVLFDGRRTDQGPVLVPVSRWPEAAAFVAALHPGTEPATFEDKGEKFILMESDDFFAWQLHLAGNVVLATQQAVPPHPLFATNALAVADISAYPDEDGVLRRAKAFNVYYKWHLLFQQVENDPGYGVDLRQALVHKGKLVTLRRSHGLEPIRIKLDDDNNFELADFLGDKLPPDWPEKAKAFSEERSWHMGIVVAAQELGLDLAHAEVDLDRGYITLRGNNGMARTIPVDRQGYFYINWELSYDDQRVAKEDMVELLKLDMKRLVGQTEGLTNSWKDKIVIVGSRAVGNELTDRGATPLDKDTFLVSKHWNVANSIIMGRFVQRASLPAELALIVVLGIGSAIVTWQFRVLIASTTIALLLVAYIALSIAMFVQYRYWLPAVFPVVGALLTMHVCLVTWRVVFEQAEQRRVKSIFSKVVSPNIVNELLQAESLSLGGARREVTVLFADVRGFTEFTDRSQEKAAAYVVDQNLPEPEVEAYFDEQARETLNTVNTYLGLVGDLIINHDGTLDKYIGDCVMAFWGSPVPNPDHALGCVRAAIEVQRAVYTLNRERAEENQRRELENLARVSAGLVPKPLLPVLQLGTGINTGMVTIGLMGSELRQSNYTVFGREVNLASRLETLSGSGRILISETTYNYLLRDDPALAATCLVLPDLQKLKGFGTAVKVYEVPWRPPGWAPFDEEFGSRATADPATTTFIRRDNL